MKILALITAMLLAAPMALAQAYLIKPGDTLEITVLEDPSLNRNALVLPDGRISMPLAGPVQASGLPIEQVQSNIADALASNFAARPNVFVSLANIARAAPTGGGVPRTIEVYVLGEVGNPGTVTVDRGTNILQLMAIIGGPTRFAATKRIQLRRVDKKTGQETMSTFNYNSIIRGGAITGAYTLADGDIVIVPERRLFE